MNASVMAQRAYATNSSSAIRTPRGTEYEVIARITHRLKAAAQNAKKDYPKFVEMLHENRRLWNHLAMEIAAPENALPDELRARLFYLSEFTRHHTAQILAGKADVVPLLEVNSAILRGLRQTPEQSAQSAKQELSP